MEIKISEEKLEKIIDVVFDGLGVDKYTSFQSRSINTYYIEFLTPGTRQNVISRYYPDLNLAVVNDEKFYDLVSDWVSSYKLYDIIINQTRYNRLSINTEIELKHRLLINTERVET